MEGKTNEEEGGSFYASNVDAVRRRPGTGGGGVFREHHGGLRRHHQHVVHQLPTAEPVAPGPVTIEVADTEVGDVLTDGDGQSLYVYLLDDEATISCVDACRATWTPVLLDGKLSVSGGIDRALFEERELEDGTVQLAIGGQPLYRYAGDLGAGAVNGQGFDKLWYLVNADGTRNTSLAG